MSEPLLSKNTELSSSVDQNPFEDNPVAPASSSAGRVFKKRAKTGSLQKSLRKPAVIPSTISDDDLSDDSDNAPPRPDIIAGRKRKRTGMISSSLIRKSTKEDFGVVYNVNQSGGTHLDPKNQATAISAEFTEAELLGRIKRAPVEGTPPDNVYRGQNAYRTLIPKREQVTTKYNAMGPQKAASNIRMTTYTDYAPGLHPFFQRKANM
jgi:hypothetical protein